jgi:hypothetical protein
MMLLAAPTRVHGDGNRLVARCQPCAQELYLHDGFHRDIALGAFFRHHPNMVPHTHSGQAGHQ